MTDTVTGAPIAGFTALLNGSRVTITAPAHVTRETAATAARVDVFPQAGFDLSFYRELTRGVLQTGRFEPLRVLPAAPAFYLETEGAKGFSVGTAERLETIARRIVPQLTGGRFQVTTWETGPTARAPQPGWIMIERRDQTGECGSSLIGDVAGSIWLGSKPNCPIDAIFAHEIGHAFGYWHVSMPGLLMYSQDVAHPAILTAPSDLEKSHMALAYARPRGNRDVDVDP